VIVPIKRHGWIPDGLIQSNFSKDNATLGVGEGVGIDVGEVVCVDCRELGSTSAVGMHPASARDIRRSLNGVG
jgi:hypothetical protein